VHSYNLDEKQYANELKRWENMRGIGVKEGVMGIEGTRTNIELYVWVSSKGQ